MCARILSGRRRSSKATAARRRKEDGAFIIKWCSKIRQQLRTAAAPTRLKTKNDVNHEREKSERDENCCNTYQKRENISDKKITMLLLERERERVRATMVQVTSPNQLTQNHKMRLGTWGLCRYCVTCLPLRSIAAFAARRATMVSGSAAETSRITNF